MGGFAHLHVHTGYSPFDGLARIPDVFARAAAAGQTACAVTDHDTLGGAPSARDAGRATGVKPVLGIEATLAVGPGDARLNRTPVPYTCPGADRPAPGWPVVLLAETPAGWGDLVWLNNTAHTPEASWGAPRIDLAALAAAHDGVLLLTGGRTGPVLGPLCAQARLLHDTPTGPDARTRRDADAAALGQLAADNLHALLDAVGPDRLYVELVHDGTGDLAAATAAAATLADAAGVPTVACADVHYLTAGMRHTQAAWASLRPRDAADHGHPPCGDGHHLADETDMRARRREPWWQEACDNTVRVAARIHDDVLPARADLLPRFPTPDGHPDNRHYLYSLLYAGADRVYGTLTPQVRARVQQELDVIGPAGMIDYFLIVHDLVDWAASTRPPAPGRPDKTPITVGPGRGSACSSMIAYLLGITRVDPLAHGLLFERFYEPGRAEPPDIDLDFPRARRPEVLEYLQARWGRDRVAPLGAWTVERSRKAIQDAGRALNAGPAASRVKAVIPAPGGVPAPLHELADPSRPDGAAYRALVASDPDARRVADTAAVFEGVVCGPSVHASGVVVSAEPLDRLVPYRLTADGERVLQFTGGEAERLGLLKIDVLGLRTLDVIDQTARYIRDGTGQALDPWHLPDPETDPRASDAWDLIAAGRTAGLFQLESAPMTDLARRVAPRSLDQLAALVALYRPGPMAAGAHDRYADTARHAGPADYSRYTADPSEQALLDGVLGDTHGMIVFQEQVMRLGALMAGFGPARRSKLRKAVSKKKPALLAAARDAFLSGAACEQHAPDGAVTSPRFAPATAEAVWEDMCGFGSYAFNKAHAVAYATLAYTAAYLKSGWPAAYTAALLAVTTDTDRRARTLAAMPADGVRLLGPDVNRSGPDTAPEGPRQVRFGLCEVAGVNRRVARLVADERAARGSYRSLNDLTLRVTDPDAGMRSVVDGRLLAGLIDAGAADPFGPRMGLHMVADAALRADLPVPPVEWGVLERASRQQSVLRTVVGEHPMDALAGRLAQVRVRPAGRPDLPVQAPCTPGTVPHADRASVPVMGMLTGWAEHPYRGGRMAVFRLADQAGTVRCVMWDAAVRAADDAGGPPPDGSLVLAAAQVRLSDPAPDPDDDSGAPAPEPTVELTVTRLTVLPVPDPPSGQMPPAPFPRVDFTAPARPRTEPAARPPAARPAGGRRDGPTIPQMVAAAAAAAADIAAGGPGVVPLPRPPAPPTAASTPAPGGLTVRVAGEADPAVPCTVGVRAAVWAASVAARLRQGTDARTLARRILTAARIAPAGAVLQVCADGRPAAQLALPGGSPRQPDRRRDAGDGPDSAVHTTGPTIPDPDPEPAVTAPATVW